MTAAMSTWMGAAAASIALISYLDAKLGLGSDINSIRGHRAAFVGLMRLGKAPPSSQLRFHPPSFLLYLIVCENSIL